MSECTCHKNYTLDTLIPQVGVITDIREETPDVKTFRVNAPDGGKLFEHMPGQCAMLCAPGISEGMFSITSSPTNKEYQEFSIKKCGILTDYLHSLEVGDEITVRGPYGNYFPVETELKGKNLLFIAGGIGLAPLRSVINYVLDNRENYGTVDIVYGSRSADDLVQLKEIQEVWMKTEGVNVYLTIDREQEGWDGHVGFVPNYVKELGFDTDKTALVCGPPIMIKFVLAGLQELGFTREQVYTTLELRMKCGVGKCGRCNIGSKYVCTEAFKDAVDFACVFGTDEHVGMAVSVRLILEDAVQDTVFLGFSAELFQLIVAHGKYLELFSAPEHTGKPRFAARLFLILQDRIEKNSQPLRSFTADLCSDLNPVQGHSHDLFCRLS